MITIYPVQLRSLLSLKIIIRHLEPTFAAATPPPAHAFEPVALMAAEGSGDYEERDTLMACIHVYTGLFAPTLAADPRFKGVLARMKLNL